MCDSIFDNSENMDWWYEEYMRLYKRHDVISAAFLVSCLLAENNDLRNLMKKRNIKDIRGSVRLVTYEGPMKDVNLSGGLDRRRDLYLNRRSFLSKLTRNMRELDRIDSQKVILPMLLLAFGRESGSCIDNAILKYSRDKSDVFMELSHFQCVTSSCPLRRSTQVSTYHTWSPRRCEDHIRVEAGPKAFLLLTFSSMFRHLFHVPKRKRACALFNDVLPALCPDHRDQMYMRRIILGRCDNK